MVLQDILRTSSEAFISNTVETEKAFNGAVVVRENENESVVSEREEVGIDKENVCVVSEGEIGLEIARSGVCGRKEVETDFKVSRFHT